MLTASTRLRGVTCRAIVGRSSCNKRAIVGRQSHQPVRSRLPRFGLVLTLVATGLEWGEATALTPANLSLATRPATIRVTKAWKRDAHRAWDLGPPKTRRARRTIALPNDLIDVLLRVVAMKAPHELLFANSFGNQLSSSRFWTSTGTPALEAACNPRRADGTRDPIAARHTKRLRTTISGTRIWRTRPCALVPGPRRWRVTHQSGATSTAFDGSTSEAQARVGSSAPLSPASASAAWPERCADLIDCPLATAA